jgi:dihydroorotase
MSLLLKNVTILDINSPVNGQVVNVLIKGGKIEKISTSDFLEPGVDLNGSYLTPGLCDIWSNFCEPGYEHKEDIDSGLTAAKAGGYTDVCTIPNTDPLIDSKSQLNFLLKTSSGYPTKLHPYASVSKSGKGEVIAELMDLKVNGAVAFTGGEIPICNSELLLKSLQYTKPFDGLVINRPIDENLTKFGQMHEGKMSTSLGMKGMPSVSEKLEIERDLNVLEYAGGKFHLSGISTAESVEVIRLAKAKGLSVTCDVPIHNLIYTDELLDSFDSNFKLNPPIRTEQDREALISGLKEGVIDCISSYHMPQDAESKELEFDLAEFGMISLQTVIPQLIKLSEEISLDLLLQKCSNGARTVLGMDQVTIEEGAFARFTVIDPSCEWVFDESSNHSKSSNSNLFGTKLVGKAKALIIGEDYIES